MTHLAFNQREIILLLKKRGTLIKAEDWVGVYNIQKQIDQVKDNSQDELMIPCHAFMTFETEEGVTRALRYQEALEADETLKDIKTWPDGSQVFIKRAPEPTDLIWENMHVSFASRVLRTICVVICIVILLAISFFLLTWLSGKQVQFDQIYLRVNCNNFVKGKEEFMGVGAFAEYLRQQELLGMDQVMRHQGFTQCFCDQ